MRARPFLPAFVLTLSGFAPISAAQDERPGTGLIFDAPSYRGTPYKPFLARSSYAELPKSVSLEKYCPTPGDQGKYGTCAAWAIGYHMRTVLWGIQHEVTDRKRLDATAFSPTFLYELAKNPGDDDCQGGTNPIRVLDVVRDMGIPRLVTLPYACNQAPTSTALLEAVDYTIADYSILFFLDEDDPNVRTETTKKAIAEGYPVVLAFVVPESFYQPGKIWREAASDNGPSGQHGRHAMLVVGYDDAVAGGAFRVLNSWGPKWADGGYVWIPYGEYGRYSLGALQAFGPRAEELAPADPGSPVKPWLAGRMRFELRDGEQMPAYRSRAEKSAGGEDLVAYRMSRSYPSGTRFRFYFTADSECYLYAYATDLTGKVTAIFPYDDGMSPHVGPASTIAFPSETKVIRMDEQPGKDYLLLLYASKRIDHVALTKSLQEAEGTLSTRLRGALGARLVDPSTVQFDAGEVKFTATRKASGTADVVPLMVEIRHD